MASSRTIIVAGAGIGGLTAALALARKGFRIVVCEHAPELSETGAGLQLSPNVARLLIELGLAEKLQPHLVAPELLSIRRARTGSEIARMQLGREIAFRYGAPYWIIHRADLQSVLRDAVLANPDIVLQLGVRVQDFATHQNGVTVQVQRGDHVTDERAVALIGADGLWSVTRNGAGVGYAGGIPRARRASVARTWRASCPLSRACGRACQHRRDRWRCMAGRRLVAAGRTR